MAKRGSDRSGGRGASSEGRWIETENVSDGSTEYSTNVRYNTTSIAVVTSEDVNGNPAGAPRYSLMLHDLHSSYIPSLYARMGQEPPAETPKDVRIENNLLVWNSRVEMNAPLTVYGARKVAFLNNTIVGDLPSDAYAFEVDMAANKFQVKDAVELSFNVTVESVRMMVMPAKTARRGRRLTIRPARCSPTSTRRSPEGSA